MGHPRSLSKHTDNQARVLQTPAVLHVITATHRIDSVWWMKLNCMFSVLPPSPNPFTIVGVNPETKNYLCLLGFELQNSQT